MKNLLLFAFIIITLSTCTNEHQQEIPQPNTGEDVTFRHMPCTLDWTLEYATDSLFYSHPVTLERNGCVDVAAIFHGFKSDQCPCEIQSWTVSVKTEGAGFLEGLDPEHIVDGTLEIGTFRWQYNPISGQTRPIYDTPNAFSVFNPEINWEDFDPDEIGGVKNGDWDFQRPSLLDRWIIFDFWVGYQEDVEICIDITTEDCDMPVERSCKTIDMYCW